MIFLASIIYDGYYLDDYQLYSDRHVELVPGDYMEIRKVQEGGEYKVLLHSTLGGLLSSLTGNGFTSGITSAGLNEAL